MLSSFACASERTEVSVSGDFVYVRSDFGTNRYLIRKIDLGKKATSRNQVVNFSGARIVSSVGNVAFDRGYVVSDEKDDATPIQFNGTHIGANHGANFGVQVPTNNLSGSDIGSRWVDGEGATFTLISAIAGESATFLSNPPKDDRPWDYKISAFSYLKPESGGSPISTSSQRLVQIYPSVRRVSLSVDPLNLSDDGFKPVDRLDVKEVYDIFRPNSDDRAAQVEVLYSFVGISTQVYTKVTAYGDLEHFSMGGVQAGPLNHWKSSLMQKITGSEQFASWQDITGLGPFQRIPVAGVSEMSQKSSYGSLLYGLSVGVSKAAVDGQAVSPTQAVMLSAAKKQYPIGIEPYSGGFSGTMHKGDVAEVWGYRRYWAGDEE